MTPHKVLRALRQRIFPNDTGGEKLAQDPHTDFVLSFVRDTGQYDSTTSIQSCLDVDFENENLLSGIQKHLSGSPASDLNSGQFFGLTQTQAAKHNATASRTTGDWTSADLKDCLASSKIEMKFPGGIDLIVSKYGLRDFTDEAEFVAAVEAIKSRLAPKGRFLYVAKKSHYRKWLYSHAVKWRRDPVQILFDIFGEPRTRPSESYFAYAFENNAAKSSDPGVIPTEVTFHFPDRNPQTIKTYFDHQLRSRILISKRRLERGAGSTNSAGAEDQKSSLICQMHFCPTPLARVRLTDAVDLDAVGSHNIEFQPNAFRRSKSFIQRANELCEKDYEHVVLGGSLDDWILNRQTGQTVVDRDEFASRFDWFVEFLSRYQPGTSHFLFAFPNADYRLPTGKGVHSRTAAEPFKAYIEKICDRYGAKFYDVSPAQAPLSQRLVGAQLKHYRRCMSQDVNHHLSQILLSR